MQGCHGRGGGSRTQLTFQREGGAALDPGQGQVLGALHGGGVLPDSRRVVTWAAKGRVRPQRSARARARTRPLLCLSRPRRVSSQEDTGPTHLLPVKAVLLNWEVLRPAVPTGPRLSGFPVKVQSPRSTACRSPAAAHLSPPPPPPGFPSHPLHRSSLHQLHSEFLIHCRLPLALAFCTDQAWGTPHAPHSQQIHVLVFSVSFHVTAPVCVSSATPPSPPACRCRCVFSCLSPHWAPRAAWHLCPAQSLVPEGAPWMADR